MSSISLNGSSAMLSPRDRLQSILDSAVSSGSVSSTDETALSGALDDIDAAMKAGGGSGTAKTGGHHGGMKAKVDSLIDTEVTDGKLTADQAKELKDLFDKAHQQMAAGGMGAPPPGAPPASTDSDDDDSSSTSATSAVSSASSATALASADSALTTLLAFVKKLEAAKADKSVYDSTGTTAASATEPLLVDETA